MASTDPVHSIDRPRPASASGPLAGLGIVITRPPRQAATLAARVAVLGAQPILCPAMLIAPPHDDRSLVDALARLHDFDYAVFVSANAAEAILVREPAWPASLTAISRKW